MSTEPWTRPLAAAWTRWTALERDWRSVTVGAMIVLSVGLFDLHVPW